MINHFGNFYSYHLCNLREFASFLKEINDSFLNFKIYHLLSNKDIKFINIFQHYNLFASCPSILFSILSSSKFFFCLLLAIIFSAKR